MNLEKLNNSIKYISQKIPNKQIRAVGGCVRDVLFDLKDQIDDIDITLYAEPKELYNNLDKSDISAFMTEKYWTITIIPKTKDDKKNQYEITPFRTESEYDDVRRPKNVSRTNSLIEDSKRREFTINCIYYTNIELDPSSLFVKDELSKNNIWKSSNPKTYLDNDKYWTFWTEIGSFLKKSKFLEIWDLWKILFFDKGRLVLLLENTDIINNVVIDWEVNLDFVLSKINKSKYNNQINEKYDIIENINSISIIIDPRNGISDMQNGILRTVWEPESRIWEDALRIIRAIRFVNTLNQTWIVKWIDHHIDIEKETRNAIRCKYYLVRTLPKERIQIELNKILVRWNLFNFVVICKEINILSDLFPSLAKTIWVWQPVRYHSFGVYEHTILCVYELQKLSNDKNLLMAMLYHDVGKVDQYYLYSIADPKKINEHWWLNHRDTSGKIATLDLEKLWFGKKDINQIVWYIDHHHKPEEIMNAKESNRIKKVRKLYSESSYDMLTNLFLLSRADRLWQYNPIQTKNTAELDYLQSILDKIKNEEWQFVQSDIVINWNWIMKKLKLKPWKTIWEILSKVFKRVSNDIKNRNNEKEILQYIKSLKL